MANYSISREDNTLAANGVGQSVDCSALPSTVHALQWYGGATPPYGEIEYAPDANGLRTPNIRFSDFSPYQFLVDAYNTALAVSLADAAALVQQQAAALAQRQAEALAVAKVSQPTASNTTTGA